MSRLGGKRRTREWREEEEWNGIIQKGLAAFGFFSMFDSGECENEKGINSPAWR